MKVLVRYKSVSGIFRGKEFMGIALVSENDEEKKLLEDMANKEKWNMILSPDVALTALLDSELKEAGMPQPTDGLKFDWTVRE